MKAREFEEKFDVNESDVINDLDLSTAKRSNQVQTTVDIDFPGWMLESLDKEANRLGVSRQSIIKVWLAERLEAIAANKAFQRADR